MDIINDIKNIDLVEQYYSIQEIIKTFFKSYKENNSWKIRLIDSFVVFNVAILVLQLIYIVLNGLYPMNSLIAGIVCAIGSITLAGYINFLYFIFSFIEISCES